MRVLLLSDIHSNFEALTAVVRDARDRGSVDAIWNLGDTVGYGPDPGQCVRFLQDEGAVSVAGNHDLGAIGRISLSDFNPYAAAACRWNGSQITQEEAAFLGSLQLRVEEDTFTLVHGSPRDPVWEYLYSEDTARQNFPLFSTPICLVGHTHVPLAFALEDSDGRQRCRGTLLAPDVPLKLEEGTRLIYNPGGVGQPRDGDPRACYALYDGEAQTITHHRVSYDIAATQQRMTAAGLPQYLIERLAAGR